MSLQDNLALVRRRIRSACQRSGRGPSSVTLVAVTKTIPAPLIQQVVQLGLTDIGENRVQEARTKRQELDAWFRAQDVSKLRWHLVGHLQSNKAKYAGELFDVIHSVDSLPLIEELQRQAAKRLPAAPAAQAGGRTVALFVQVNVSGEPTKYGCRPEEAEALARAIRASSHLVFGGLMTIAPLTSDPEATRPIFRALRELRDALAARLGLGATKVKLSMGMSQDFEVAIEEGADVVRIGTAIFGARD